MRSLPPLTYIPSSSSVTGGKEGRAEEAGEAAYKKGQKGHSGLRWRDGRTKALIPSCSSPPTILDLHRVLVHQV